MGQLERGLNRLYGVERDRPTVRKYGVALLLTLSAGFLATVAFMALALGGSIGSSLDNDLAARVWSWIRWPLALLFMTASVALLFKSSPRRRQPAWSWLMYGALVSVALWTVATLSLSFFFRTSSGFGETYGPLAGIVAQLEAVRAGATPKDR
jgi:YihY family inner membrane protein